VPAASPPRLPTLITSWSLRRPGPITQQRPRGFGPPASIGPPWVRGSGSQLAVIVPSSSPARARPKVELLFFPARAACARVEPFRTGIWSRRSRSKGSRAATGEETRTFSRLLRPGAPCPAFGLLSGPAPRLPAWDLLLPRPRWPGLGIASGRLGPAAPCRAFGYVCFGGRRPVACLLGFAFVRPPRARPWELLRPAPVCRPLAQPPPSARFRPRPSGERTHVWKASALLFSRPARRPGLRPVSLA